MSSFERKARAALAFVFCAILTGCGTPSAPLPPSLNLPDPVGDLSAIRTGDEVALTWTMPKRNTDKTPIKAVVAIALCRREGAGECIPVRTGLLIGAGAAGRFTDTLPGSLASGEARALSYFVELQNKKGRSAGPSNAATVLAGEAPLPIEGLRSEVRKQGVMLSWAPDGENAAVRLQRRLLTQPATKSQRGPLAPAPEAIEETLLIDDGARQGRAIDKTIRFGESYEYRAQRVSRVDVNGKMVELAGALSAPIDVEAKDVFPPNVPAGLVAVATAGANGAGPAIDLSWQPDADPDVAGYIVYRRESDGDWQRISAATPAIEPAFHDAQVQPGHTYHYVVSAVGKDGRESDRSVEAQDTVAQQ